MKVRVDVILGEERSIDLAFLERRRKWLPYTGIYLEFLLKGEYSRQIDFKVTSLNNGVTVTRHAWNRFFLNIQKQSTVNFSVLEGGDLLVERDYTFDVANVEVPLMFSVLDLFGYPVSDVRFFANRLAENLVNSTRIHLFTLKTLERLSRQEYNLGEAYWRLMELLFSILTERGITVYVTPFGQRVPYPLNFLPKLKPLLWTVLDRCQKFHVVWDFSEGLRKKELGSFVDSIAGKYGTDIPMVVRSDMTKKVGGEGFGQQFIRCRFGDTHSENEKGVKILRLRESVSDFYKFRQFVSDSVSKGYGVEYVYYPKAKSLHNMHYSLSRALYSGYEDAKG